MKIYTVYNYKNSKFSSEQSILINEGFSFNAFIFTGFWSLYHRLWLFTLLIILINIGIGLLISKNLIAINYSYLISFIINLIIGFYATDIHRYILIKKGYYLSDIIGARNLEEAQFRLNDHYFMKHKNEKPFL